MSKFFQISFWFSVNPDRKKNHIFSIFSNDSGSLLPTPNTDVVKRIEVSTNFILVRSIEKIQKLASQIQHFRTPLITVSSILLVLVLCLFGSCIARQITEIQIRRKAKKSRKLETYFHRRTLQESMNSPPYETVNIEMEWHVSTLIFTESSNSIIQFSVIFNLYHHRNVA